MRAIEPTQTPESRKGMIYKDQHGRRWDVSLDKDTLCAATPPIPLFRAPLMPPPEYVSTDADQLGLVLINYARWQSDWSIADTRYRARFLERLRYEKDPTTAEELEGEPPQSAEFVKAARAGNRWVLGLPHPVPGKRYVMPDALLPFKDRLTPRSVARDSGHSALSEDDRLKYADAEADDEVTEAIGVMAVVDLDSAYGDAEADDDGGFGTLGDADDADDDGFGEQGTVVTSLAEDFAGVPVATRRRGRPPRAAT